MEFSSQISTFEKFSSTRQIYLDINNLSLRHSTGLVFHLARNCTQLTFKAIKYLYSDTPDREQKFHSSACNYK